VSVTYTYERARNRLTTVCTGDVGFVDVVNHFHVLSLDASIQAGVDVLLDFATITSAPEEEQLETLKESLRRTAAQRPFGRCAVVAAGPPGLDVATQFIRDSATQFTATRVFPSRAAATAWLDARKAPL
jgi:hypothetical protein